MQNHEESPGERAIKTELLHMGIRFEQEKRIFGLRGDTKKFRDADFYLPEHDVYIEFAGGWNSGDKEKKRYRHKRIIYEKNGIKCIWIYPKQLYYSSRVIGNRLKKFEELEIEPERPINKVMRIPDSSPDFKTNTRWVGYVLSIIFIIIAIVSSISLFTDSSPTGMVTVSNLKECKTYCTDYCDTKGYNVLTIEHYYSGSCDCRCTDAIGKKPTIIEYIK